MLLGEYGMPIVDSGLDRAELTSGIDEELMDDFSEVSEAVEDNVDNVSYVEDWCPYCAEKCAHAVVVENHRQILICVDCNEQHDKELTGNKDKIELKRVRKEELASEEKRKDAWKRYAMNEENVKAYNIKSKYEIMDIISHIKYGKGLICDVNSDMKIDVLFSDGSIRKLISGR